MKLDFSNAEGRVLHGLIKDAGGDIVVRLDSTGFIIHATANASQLGIDLSSLLLMPHISDFADPDHTAELAQYVERVFDDDGHSGWIEFPLRNAEGPYIEGPGDNWAEQRWYAFNLRLIEDDGAQHGAMGLLRPIQQKQLVDGEINAHAAIDPLTGLATQQVFGAELQRSLASDSDDALAVFSLDSLRAIFMQYGQKTTEEVQWGFARFLEAMTIRGHLVAHLYGERFGVLLNGTEVQEAHEWADDVLRTFAGLAVEGSARRGEILASAGLARVELSTDRTLRQAELGLVMARAGGGMRAAIGAQSAGTIDTMMVNNERIDRAVGALVRSAQSRCH